MLQRDEHGFVLKVSVSALAVHRAIPPTEKPLADDEFVLLPGLEPVRVLALHSSCPAPAPLQMLNAARGYDRHKPTTPDEHARWWRSMHGVSVTPEDMWFTIAPATGSSEESYISVPAGCVLQTLSGALIRHTRDKGLRSKLKERIDSDISDQIRNAPQLLPNSKFAITSCVAHTVDSHGAVMSRGPDCSGGSGGSDSNSVGTNNNFDSGSSKTQWLSGSDLLLPQGRASAAPEHPKPQQKADKDFSSKSASQPPKLTKSAAACAVAPTKSKGCGAKRAGNAATETTCHNTFERKRAAPSSKAKGKKRRINKL